MNDLITPKPEEDIRRKITDLKNDHFVNGMIHEGMIVFEYLWEDLDDLEKSLAVNSLRMK